ncbi:MAG: hypothetical protein QFC78_05485 [Pseudomonadota bacterium]|nr:hypothetical protein [Pseudomonadota bacterium]
MTDFLFSDIANQNLRAGTDIVQTSGRDAIGSAPWRYASDTLATAALQGAHPRFVARSSNGRYWRALPETGRIAVEVGGAKGDGAADDGPAIRATFAYANAIGARGVSFGSAKYRAELILPTEQVMTSNPPIQQITTSGIHDYGGAAFTRQSGGRGLVYHPANVAPIVELPLAADVLPGARDFTLVPGAGANLTVGDTVMWQLGDFPYDPAETPNWSFAVVEIVTGDTVRLDRPSPEGLSIAGIGLVNKRLRKLNVLRGHVIRDLTLGGTAAEDGISLTCAERVRIERVGGRNLGAGTVVAQYCDGLTLEDCWQDGCILTQASFGAAFAFAETRNVMVVRPRAKATLSLIKAEAGAQVTVIGGRFENTLTNPQGQPLGTQVTVINAVGRASVTVHDLTVTGYGGYRLLETSNGQLGYDGSALFSGTLRLNHPTAPYSVPLSGVTGTLDLTIAGTREIYNFERLRHWRKRFVLRDGEYRYAFGPAGLLARARVYATPGVTVGNTGQLTGLWLGRLGNNGANLADGPNREVEPGRDANVGTYAGDVGGALWTLRNQPLSLLCTTAPSAGLNAANEFVEFEGWFAEQTDLDVSLSEDAYRIAGDEQDPLEAWLPGYDLPAIAAGTSATITLAIPDMQPTDFIDSVRFVGGFGGLELRGAEPQAGSLKLVLVNPGGAAIDRAPTDLGVSFHREVSGN